METALPYARPLHKALIVCCVADPAEQATEETNMVSQAAMLTAKLGSSRLKGICAQVDGLLGQIVRAQQDGSGKQPADICLGSKLHMLCLLK